MEEEGGVNGPRGDVAALATLKISALPSDF